MADAGIAFPTAAAAALVAAALQEDLGTDRVDTGADLTAAAVVPVELAATARIVSRGPGVIAGLPAVRLVFAALDPTIEWLSAVADGQYLAAGAPVLAVRGNARALLAAERTALNLLQRLSGVATLTAAFVAAVAGTRARITDTRKTTPGMRLLEKYAVRVGGGVNHRMGLHDAVLIKENHAASAGGVAAAVRQARRFLAQTGRSDAPVYAEARTLAEVDELRLAPPDRIMLDNMTAEDLATAVRRIRQLPVPPVIEATGGVNLATVRGVAETGVDLISVGALTHSAPALDLSLLFASVVA
jgi:nicotinate-nucleotide pyrophosphorylase (carboxylating)